jgi:outer membrane protein TolC
VFGGRQLLARRPDVAVAEQNVVATNARIGVATAEFYPRFMLTTSAGFESANLSTLLTWQGPVASIAPSIAIPICKTVHCGRTSTRPRRDTGRPSLRTSIRC